MTYPISMATVITNGVYDLLHPGHFNLLTFCRQIADVNSKGRGKVIVAIDEDIKVMADKGLQRPIFDEHHRAKALLDLKISDRQLVDAVHFFSTNLMLLHIIKRERPDYIVKGSDWEGRTVVGSEVARVVFFPRLDYSTTEIIRRVVDKNTLLK
jgi:cytidyltransferase-like protein